MSEALRKIVEKAVESDTQKLLEKLDTDDEKENFEQCKKALKEKIYNQIQEEIKEKFASEIADRAEEKINQRASQKKIEELKKLTINGFIVAFLVGLFVNQVTDFIGKYKGSVSLTNIWPTVVIILVLFVLCVIVFIIMFLDELLKIVGRNNEFDERNKGR